MKPGNDQDAIQNAIYEKSDLASTDDTATKSVHCAFYSRPAKSENCSHNNACASRRNRYETAPTEKRQKLRKLDVIVPIIQETSDQSRDNADRHAQFPDCPLLERCFCQPLSTIDEICRNFRRDGN